MGSKSKPPSPPDPRETAGAQTANNIGTAVANAYLNNTNQVGPYGSLTYNQTGQTAWSDPNTGQTYQIPQFTQTTQLSPMQEAIGSAGDQAQLNLANLAGSQSARLQDLLGSPMDLSGVPQRPGIPGQYDYQNFSGFSGLQSSLPDAGNIQRRLGSSGPIIDLKSLGGLITSLPQNMRDKLRTMSDGAKYEFADAGDITRTYGGPDDFGDDRLRVEQALMERMDPYLQRQQESVRSNLANQGLMLGSEGYKRGIDDYFRSENDARLGAILGAGEEQARLVGMERDRAGFENAAQAQQYGQNLGRAQFYNQGLAQDYGHIMGAAGFLNNAQQQRFGQNLAGAQFGNQAQQQQFGQNLQGAQFGNNALQQMYDNYFRATAANNQLQDARFNQDAARYGMQNDARSQALQEMYQYRNQPINEISALLSGSQVSYPQFGGTPQYQIPTTDYAGLVNQNYNQQLAAHQMQNQFGQNLMGGLFGLGAGYLSGGYM